MSVRIVCSVYTIQGLGKCPAVSLAVFSRTPENTVPFFT